MNLMIAMARMALLLDRARQILDSPKTKPTLRTLEISELDVEALHRCMQELVELRRVGGSGVRSA